MINNLDEYKDLISKISMFLIDKCYSEDNGMYNSNLYCITCLDLITNAFSMFEVDPTRQEEYQNMLRSTSEESYNKFMNLVAEYKKKRIDPSLN